MYNAKIQNILVLGLPILFLLIQPLNRINDQWFFSWEPVDSNVYDSIDLAMCKWLSTIFTDMRCASRPKRMAMLNI